MATKVLCGGLYETVFIDINMKQKRSLFYGVQCGIVLPRA